MANSNPTVENSKSENKFNRLHLVGILFTLGGLALFVYFILSVGVEEIFAGIARIGFGGFALILLLYFLRIAARSQAWKLSVSAPDVLDLRDTIPAVIIGEALSSLIPLGILVSGTAKAIAVRQKVSLVVGLSSVATENLFYSFGTGLFIVFGAFAALKSLALPDGWVWTINLLIGVIFVLTILGFMMVIRQWHWASAICEKLYERGIGRGILENGRFQVRLFENLIYGFYREYPRRFAPIFLLQIVFHALGVAEVWFILSRINDASSSFYTSFLLESISRVITVFFKLIPFLIGVDEAGAQFVTETLALGVGLGVMIAIIRKGRILFWTAIGVILILKRGLSLQEIFQHSKSVNNIPPEQ